jgi:competence protein ComGF
LEKLVIFRKKLFVVLQNENAFTMGEMLFAFSIFTFIIFFISPIFSIILQQQDEQKRLQTMEWEVFCSQIKKEIRMSTKAQVIGNRLILTEDPATIVFEQYQNVLRRRVNSTGHEVLLQNVSEVNFSLATGTIQVEVKDINKRQYTVNIYSFINGGAP